MPIVFEQPQPINMGISAGAGALQQYESDRSFYQKQQQIQQQAQQQRFQQELAAAQFQASQVPSQKDQWQADQASEGQKQKYDLQAQLQQTELTQAETMRLSRLKNALGQVAADDNLSDSEKADAITKLKTGIDPLQQRAAQTKQKQEELQFKAMQAQMVQQETIAQANAVFRAKSMEERVAVVKHPETGEELHMFEEKPGHWAPIPWGSEHEKGTRGRARSGAPDAPIDTSKIWADAVKSNTSKETGKVDMEAAMAQVDAIVAHMNKQRAASTPATPAKPQPFSMAQPNTPEQKVIVEKFQEAVSKIDEANISPEAKTQAKSYLKEAETVLAKYGSEAAMPEDVRKSYNLWRSLADGATQESVESFYARRPEGIKAAADAELARKRKLNDEEHRRQYPEMYRHQEQMDAEIRAKVERLAEEKRKADEEQARRRAIIDREYPSGRK